MGDHRGRGSEATDRNRRVAALAATARVFKRFSWEGRSGCAVLFVPHWVCGERGGPTPSHPEPGRETPQRRYYWRSTAGTVGPCTLTIVRFPTSLACKLNSSGNPTKTIISCRGVEQWQLVGLITRRSVVRIHSPLPIMDSAGRQVLKSICLFVCNYCCNKS